MAFSWVLDIITGNTAWWQQVSFIFMHACVLVIYIYIVIQRQTASSYHNSSARLDTRITSSWDRNPANFTSVGHLTHKPSSFAALEKNLFRNTSNKTRKINLIFYIDLISNRYLSLCADKVYIKIWINFSSFIWGVSVLTKQTYSPMPFRSM